MSANRAQKLFIIQENDLSYINELLDRVPCQAIRDVTAIRSILSMLVPLPPVNEQVGSTSDGNDHLD